MIVILQNRGTTLTFCINYSWSLKQDVHTEPQVLYVNICGHISVVYNTLLFLLSSKLILTVDSTDDNYMPKRVTVFGGEGDNLKKLSDVTIDE